MAGGRIERRPTAISAVTALVLAISSFIFCVGLSASAEAKIVRLEIASKQSYGTFRPGEFLFWEGRVVGELQPTEKIPDIEKPPGTPRGWSNTRQGSR